MSPAGHAGMEGDRTTGVVAGFVVRSILTLATLSFGNGSGGVDNDEGAWIHALHGASDGRNRKGGLLVLAEVFGGGGIPHSAKRGRLVYKAYAIAWNLLSLPVPLNSSSLIRLFRALFIAMISLEDAIPYVPPTLVPSSRDRKKVLPTDPRAAILQRDRPQNDINRALSFPIPGDPPRLSGTGKALLSGW